MCLRPFHLRYQTFDGSWRESDVPCGKCEECVRRAQSDLMILCARELDAAHGPSWFVTLTYQDSTLPLSYVVSRYAYVPEGSDTPRPLAPYEVDILAQDRKKWRLVERSKPFRLSRAPFRTHSDFDNFVCSPSYSEHWSSYVSRRSLSLRENAVRMEYAKRFRWNGTQSKQAWNSSPCSVGSCIKPGCVLELSRWIEDGLINVCTVCTTVDRKDVQLWLKSARVAFERRFGRKLPEDMSYVFVQEYGPEGHRPHYHLLFTNIEEKDLVWILSRWCTDFCGTERPCKDSGVGVVYSAVEAVNKNGNYPASSAGKYLGSYMKKLAAFDDKMMVSGLCIRPRKCSSKFFGIGKDFDKLRSNLLGFDIFGVYDPADPSTYPVDMESVFEVIQRRMKYSLPVSQDTSRELPLPQYLKAKIYKNVKEKVSYRKVPRRWTPLSFDSYCESSGFGCKPFELRPVLCRYPASSELSQGLADLAAFRSDLVYKEQLRTFAGLDPSASGDLSSLPPEVFCAFADSLSLAVSQKAAYRRDVMRSVYQKSQF